MIFLDTNVVCEPTRAKADQEVVAWINKFGADLAISTVVLAEISFGIERLKPELRSKRLSNFLDDTRKIFISKIYAFDDESALIFGKIMGQAFHTGRTMKTADAMIAAITLRHKASLATRNVVDFDFLEIMLVNPWS